MHPLLLIALLITASASYAVPSPLPDLQKPPVKPHPQARQLPPLLSGSPESASARTDWDKQAEALRAQWTTLLGEFPKQKVPLQTEFLAKEELPTFTRQTITYQIEADVRTDAVLLVPKGATGKLPTIVLFHPTYAEHYKRVVGLEGEEEPERQQAIQLVHQGYIVVVPRCFLWSEIPEGFLKPGENGYAARVRKMQESHPSWKGITRMTWDGIRALDLAESLPMVDPARLGIFGHSLGAKEVLYVAAFDGRPRCVVSSEGGIGLRQSNWEAVWYLGPEIRNPEFARENHELLALIAPRPVLVLAGGEGKGAADTDASWALIEAALPIYRLLGAPQNIGWFNHGLGHRYGAEARSVAEGFLENRLKHFGQ